MRTLNVLFPPRCRIPPPLDTCNFLPKTPLPFVFLSVSHLSGEGEEVSEARRGRPRIRHLVPLVRQLRLHIVGTFDDWTSALGGWDFRKRTLVCRLDLHDKEREGGREEG